MNSNNSGSNTPEKRKKGTSRWETEESDSDKEENKRLKSDIPEKEGNGKINLNNSINENELNEIYENNNQKKEIKIIEHNPLIEVYQPYFSQVQGCREVYCYTRIKYLGQGTYGSVYLAEDNETKERYALKKVKVEPRLSSEGFPITALRETNSI